MERRWRALSLLPARGWSRLLHFIHVFWSLPALSLEGEHWKQGWGGVVREEKKDEMASVDVWEAGPCITFLNGCMDCMDWTVERSGWEEGCEWVKGEKWKQACIYVSDYREAANLNEMKCISINESVNFLRLLARDLGTWRAGRSLHRVGGSLTT